MNSSEAADDFANKERQWLSWIEQQSDAVMIKCRLPEDRAATSAEMQSFFAGLDEMARACAAADAAASQLAAAGFHALADRLALIRKDVQGAREVFKQPRSKDPGPLTKRMRELKDEQRNLEAFAQSAAELVQSEPLRARELLIQAGRRFELLFDALGAVVPKLPSSDVEMPLLAKDRQETKAQMLALQAIACTRLQDFDAAQQFYEEALRQLPPDHPNFANLQNGLQQLQNLRILKRGYV